MSDSEIRDAINEAALGYWAEFDRMPSKTTAIIHAATALGIDLESDGWIPEKYVETFERAAAEVYGR